MVPGGQCSSHYCSEALSIVGLYMVALSGGVRSASNVFYSPAALSTKYWWIFVHITVLLSSFLDVAFYEAEVCLPLDTTIPFDYRYVDLNESD